MRNSSRLLLLALVLVISGCGGSNGYDDDYYQDINYPYDNGYIPPPVDPNSPGNQNQLFAYYDSYDTVANSILVVDRFYGVLNNDIYPIGDTYVSFPRYSVQGAYINGNTTGSFEYDPVDGFTGEDSFTYTIEDSTGRTSSAKVFINVYAE